LNFLIWLSNTDLATYVGESDWAYPIILTLHGLGMAALVGSTWMLDIRTLGFPREMPPATPLKFVPIAWAGFFLNLASGLLLFIQNAPKYVKNPPFLTKMTLIVLGGVFTWTLVRRYRQEIAIKGDMAPLSPAARTMAIASFLFWLGAIVAGRLIAYIK